MDHQILALSIHLFGRQNDRVKSRPCPYRLRIDDRLFSVALATVIARMVVDGPKPLDGLAGALILVLLLCSVALRRQGVRLQPGVSSETERADAR
jgi:hypothetical protein